MANTPAKPKPTYTELPDMYNRVKTREKKAKSAAKAEGERMVEDVLTLASAGGRVCYHNFEEVVCLNLRSGKELWRAESKTWPDLTGTAVGSGSLAARRASSTVSLT